jgi:hypothetical protein
MRRRIHAWHMRRRIHAWHMRRRIHTWLDARFSAHDIQTRAASVLEHLATRAWARV